MVTSLRSKWAAGKARGGSISQLIRNRRATQPPARYSSLQPYILDVLAFVADQNDGRALCALHRNRLQ
jgi:hypothetical protein